MSMIRRSGSRFADKIVRHKEIRAGSLRIEAIHFDNLRGVQSLCTHHSFSSTWHTSIVDSIVVSD
jgi:hypothetical protein